MTMSRRGRGEAEEKQIVSIKGSSPKLGVALVVLVATGQQYDECAKARFQCVKWQLRVVDAGPALRWARAGQWCWLARRDFG